MPLVIKQGNRVLAGTIYVPRGKAVTFQAAFEPPQNPPPDMTTAAWTFTAGSAAAAAGASATYTFTTASARSDTASASIRVAVGGASATVPVIVYDLVARLAPLDTVQGQHHATHFGVDERVDLSYDTVPNTPAKIAAAALGGLKWTVVGTSGRRDDGIVRQSATQTGPATNDGTGHYIAPYMTREVADKKREHFWLDETKQVAIELAVQSGIAHAVRTNLTIYAPRAHMVVATGSAWHEANNAPDAGFYGLIHTHPKDVSFRTLNWREGIGPMILVPGDPATNYFGFNMDLGAKTYKARESIHAYTGMAMTISDGNPAVGCYVNQIDTVWTGHDPSRVVAGVGVAAGAGLAIQVLPSVLQNFKAAAFLKEQMPLAKGAGKVTPSVAEWRIIWEYRVRPDLDPPPGDEGTRWIQFQVAVHRMEVDGNGTAKIQKSTPGQTWSIASATKAMTDAVVMRSAKNLVVWPPACADNP